MREEISQRERCVWLFLVGLECLFVPSFVMDFIGMLTLTLGDILAIMLLLSFWCFQACFLGAVRASFHLSFRQLAYLWAIVAIGLTRWGL